MKMIFAVFAMLLVLGSGSVVAEELKVFKSPYCGCCSAWVDHLKEHGFKVKVVETDDMDRIKTMAGVPEGLDSCHTAIVEGYIIEGHVPARDIARLLEERPDIRGLSVPGMPHGSPGMETGHVDPYDVLTFMRDGSTEVYARY